MKLQFLIESHITKSTPELESLAFKCKNLYNKANYTIRQEFINNRHYISKFDMFKIAQQLDEYKAMPVRISRGVLRTLDGNWKSFFSCIKKWKTNKNLFKGKPNLPKYLNKKGKFTAIFYETAILKPNKKKPNTIGFSSLQLRITPRTKNKIIEVQIVPLKSSKFKINIVYDYTEEKLKSNNDKYCAIDLGLNNLMTVTSNQEGNIPFIINGRPLKSINQFYNKTKANLQSKLPENVFNSKKINGLTFKRECKINDYLHKSSYYIVQYCLSNNINTLILGYNEFWKQNIDLGSKINQNFVQIPFNKLKWMLEYKCQKHGLNFIEQEESYTSKCSFLDNETIGKHDDYKGSRIKRGLFKSSKGNLINADVNGSYNIMKKAVPNAFANGIEGVAVHPSIINLN
jgi:putative transposase